MYVSLLILHILFDRLRGHISVLAVHYVLLPYCLEKAVVEKSNARKRNIRQSVQSRGHVAASNLHVQAAHRNSALDSTRPFFKQECCRCCLN